MTTEPTLARARQLLPWAQTVLYPSAGHAHLLEDSGRFDQDLLRFVAQVNAVH
ncbi:pimeloyl-ACP methyl ester carboxylesterase [Xanthomonas arboricola]|nr:pimeloyl-ACP methyl ester carboxylesterase [Xanthomonas sp. 3075]MBB5866316.1 pimeloyl-ACP methyl ester carboxylesterase [Xanthomonas sp. 3058]